MCQKRPMPYRNPIEGVIQSEGPRSKQKVKNAKVIQSESTSQNQKGGKNTDPQQRCLHNGAKEKIEGFLEVKGYDG